LVSFGEAMREDGFTTKMILGWLEEVGVGIALLKIF
jgi:hypothetical protein